MERRLVFAALAALSVITTLITTSAKSQNPTYCTSRGTEPWCDGDCKAGEVSREPAPCSIHGSKHLCCRYPAAALGEIRSSVNNKCLDADLNDIGANGTKVQLWDC